MDIVPELMCLFITRVPGPVIRYLDGNRNLKLKIDF